MKRPTDVIITPMITEKSNECIAENKYTFKVATNATKTEIRQAVEIIFQVKVLKVNTSNYEGKLKRQGHSEGRRPNWKKAIVKIDADPKTLMYKIKGGKYEAASKKYKTEIEEFGIVK